jgi:uncharacterized NAD(P)/FAD-binding protein YdhS
LRSGGDQRVTLLESGPRLGRGIAYGTTDPAHLLNTRAERMSLLGGDPTHFVRWSRARGRETEPTDFLARSMYGDYLEDTLNALASGVGSGMFSAQSSTEVRDVAPLHAGFAIVLDGGATLPADEVVLATGHPLPGDPLAHWLPAGAPRYLRDPWRSHELAAIGSDDRVLLLGTGLTMVDVVLTLTARGHRANIGAVSRRGLLPRAHSAAHEPLPQDLVDELRRGLSLGNLRRALRVVRGAAAAAEDRGLDWQAVVDALRASTEPFWGALCAADRRRFLQHLRPYWDVHRHRLPPPTAERLAALVGEGRLHVRAARVCAASVTDRGIAVSTRERHGDGTAHYDWIVNCTGPSFAKQSCRALERRLLERGLLIADPLALGFVTTPDGRAFGAHGPVEGLYVLGPACRSQRWEHTAVPELREQARALAVALRRDQSAAPALRQR